MANTARNQSKKIEVNLCPTQVEGPEHPRESMKSSIDFYQRTYNADDLISLYRHTRYYVYAICKYSLASNRVAGFCESSLGQVERLCLEPHSQWEPLPPVLVPRTKFCVAHLQRSEVLILGGKDPEGQRTDSVEVFDGQRWRPADFKLRKPRSGFALVQLEEKLVVIGGNDGRVQNRVECMNLKTRHWSKLPKMNMKRDELAACMGPDGRIYAIGGYGGGENSCLASAERFDLKTGKWELIAPMKEPRRALSAVALPDGIYAIGGYNGKEYVATVERYDIFSNEWVAVTPMRRARCTLSAVVSGDCQYIYALGGFNGTALSSVERYDVTKDAWEEVASMQQKRFMHACLVLGHV